MRFSKVKIVVLVMIAGIFFLYLTSFAQQVSDLKPYAQAVEQVKKGMTLWEMVKTGGFVMIVLALLSIAAVANVIYSFVTLKVNQLAPKSFVQEITQKLEDGKDVAAKSMCTAEKNILSNIVIAGIEKKNKGQRFLREAMENATHREITHLWQKISYLADIAAISPLVGLLGTVLGMIQAFNVIAFQTAVVKPILLAGGISKAMVTTAGGLIIAIPVMLLYAYFRGKVQLISDAVENYSADLIKVIEDKC